MILTDRVSGFSGSDSEVSNRSLLISNSGTIRYKSLCLQFPPGNTTAIYNLHNERSHSKHRYTQYTYRHADQWSHTETDCSQSQRQTVLIACPVHYTAEHHD